MLGLVQRYRVGGPVDAPGEFLLALLDRTVALHEHVVLVALAVEVDQMRLAGLPTLASLERHIPEPVPDLDDAVTHLREFLTAQAVLEAREKPGGHQAADRSPDA